MVSTIDMQHMRYINLFRKITGIQTRFCFKYNEFIVFGVPKMFVSKAVGEEGRNVKKMHMMVNKKIKIIPLPKDSNDVKSFIESIVSPVTFKNVEVKDTEILLTAGSQSKAALIGRNKRRLLEMQKIIREFFNKEFKII